ncbi:MAG TPA: hypothetical protein PKH33_07675 [bacterium]|nr:hypothetical protein [bacterium]
MPQNETNEKVIVRRKAVKYLHSEIHARYRICSLENVPDIVSKKLLDGIDQNDIDRLEALFLSAVYPELDNRAERDKSFESLIKLLKNPRALVHIIPSIPGIMIKHGARFPQALRIGLNSVIAFNLSNHLENTIVENIFKECRERCLTVNEGFAIEPEMYRRAYVMTPCEDATRMVKLAKWVMTAGSDRAVVDTAWSVLNEVSRSLEIKDQKRVESGLPAEHADDIRAISYGKSVVDNIRNIFGDYEKRVMLRMIDISWLSEIDYIDRMYTGKRN